MSLQTDELASVCEPWRIRLAARCYIAEQNSLVQRHFLTLRSSSSSLNSIISNTGDDLQENGSYPVVTSVSHKG